MNRKNLFLVIRTFLILLVFLNFAASCIIKRPSEGSGKAGLNIKNTVVAVEETMPVPQRKNEDSADDAAIWIHPGDSQKSVVIGTDKKGGLATYNLEGDLLNYYPHGNMNNCDLRYGFGLGDQKIDLLASSNRTTHSLALYKILPGGVLEEIHARIINSEMKDEVYGLCLYKSPKTGSFFVYVNSKKGEIEQWELFDKAGKVDARLVRAFNLKTQTEGMVADDDCASIYIGEEQAGICKFNAEPDGSNIGKILDLSTEENKNIRFDIEGLTIYTTEGENGYLIASSQGNYSYAVFERQGKNKYLGSFRIVDGVVDGVEETDGIDVTNVSLGSKFSKGMLVVQDGYNYEGEKLASQNFKFISWDEIERVIRKF